MAINAPQTAGNGATGNYHRINKFESDCSPSSTVPRLLVYVGFYASEAHRDLNPTDPMCTNTFYIPFSALPTLQPSEMVGGDLRPYLYRVLMTMPPFAGSNAAPSQSDDPAATLEAIKARKNDEIDMARLEANSTSFTFQECQIAYDRVAQLDIAGVNGKVALTGSLPDNWPGGWNVIGGGYVAIPDVATWTDFYSAMVNQGIANFAHAQALKAAVAAAETAEEVSAIVWGTEP